MKRLLAKSSGQEPHCLLYGHLEDVWRAAEAVLDATLADQLTIFGLDPQIYSDRLRRIVPMASVLHDIGKANDHFQDAINRGSQQGVRHEWATILFLQFYPFEDWLRPLLVVPDPDRFFV